MKLIPFCAGLLCASVVATTAFAGPPYVTDDPEPTDTGHFEIYTYGAGTNTVGGTDGEAGLDFNYGILPNTQLSITLPVAYDAAAGGPTIGGFGNVELGVKYRFLHQDDIGLDVSVFPRVFFPSASHRLGEQHASFFLPLWIEKDIGSWSAFGGGGCLVNHGGDSKNFCLMGAATTYQVLPKLQLGAEVFHQTADTFGGQASTGLGFGARYDFTELLHLVASAGPGIENAAETNRHSWYAALLFTF